MNEGWIKLFKKFREWGWYKDSNTVRVWLEILLTANYEDKEWQGILIKKGQLITSVSHLSKNLNISTKSIRTSLNHLKMTNEVAIQTTSNYTLITVIKYCDYQEVANDKANKGQTTGKRLATTKEYKNIRIIQTEKNDTDFIGEKLLEHFNKTMKKKVKSFLPFKTNMIYWLGIYSKEEIATAISRMPNHNFFKLLETPVTLFRKKNQNREDVDYIGQLLNMAPIKKEGGAINNLINE